MKSVLMYAFRKKKGSIFPMFYKNDVAEESIHPSMNTQSHNKKQRLLSLLVLFQSSLSSSQMHTHDNFSYYPGW